MLLLNANASKLVAGETLVVEDHINPAVVKCIWYNLNLKLLSLELMSIQNFSIKKKKSQSTYVLGAKRWSVTPVILQKGVLCLEAFCR